MGDHLRRRRLDLGLTQQTVATQWGVRPETVTSWELGRSQPSAAVPGHHRLPRRRRPATLGDPPGKAARLRRRLGLTQADFAARVGQDEHQICRWEKGRLRPHPWIAGRLDLELRALEGRPVENSPTLSFFDLTRWRRKPPQGIAIRPETFGDWLRARRLQLGLSMDDLGRRVKTNRGMIYRLERGKQTPSAQLRTELERVLTTA